MALIIVNVEPRSYRLLRASLVSVDIDGTRADEERISVSSWVSFTDGGCWLSDCRPWIPYEARPLVFILSKDPSRCLLTICVVPMGNSQFRNPRSGWMSLSVLRRLASGERETY